MILYNLIRQIEKSKWNIGFAKLTPDELLNKNKGLEKVEWLKHSYKDRFFADPFLLSVSDSLIEVLVEEFMYETNKGRIALLQVDARDFSLINRKTILELDTHLSYPAIMCWNNKKFIYPENGADKRISLYEFNEFDMTCRFYRDILSTRNLNEIDDVVWPADSTIFEHNQKYWLFMTPDVENSKLMIFNSNMPIENYKQQTKIGKTNNIENSRAAGNLFKCNGVIYRPVQNCREGYGKSIKIQRIIELSEDNFQEETVMELHPCSNIYNRGLHTINFKKNLCVVDGRGYRYPIAKIISPIIEHIFKLRQLFKH